MDMNRIQIYDNHVVRRSRKGAQEVSHHFLHRIFVSEGVIQIDDAGFRREFVFGGVQTNQLDVEAPLDRKSVV